MNIDFQIEALEKQKFSKYFKMTGSELGKIGAYLFSADQNPYYPCRVSLSDAAPGESVLALSYEHHPKASPYRSSGPIFVRENAESAGLQPNEIPEMFRHRLLSIRGYSSQNIMIEADVIAGTALENAMNQQFLNSEVDYLHIHNAGPGCFNCVVRKA